MEIVHDFPGGEWRRVQRAEGYHAITVNGEVTSINEKLIDDPTRITDDPYGKGWMVKIKVEPGSNLDHLMTLEKYEKQIASEDH